MSRGTTARSVWRCPKCREISVEKDTPRGRQRVESFRRRHQAGVGCGVVEPPGAQR